MEENSLYPSYPSLNHLFGAYFGQDYDESGDTLEEVVNCFKKDEALSDKGFKKILSEIEHFKANHPHDLDAAFEAAYRSRFVPALWGYTTTASFFDTLTDILKKELVPNTMKTNPGYPAMNTLFYFYDLQDKAAEEYLKCGMDLIDDVTFSYYKRDRSPEEKSAVLAEIERFRSEHKHNLTQALIDIYNLDLSPKGWNISPDDFLDRLAYLIKAPLVPPSEKDNPDYPALNMFFFVYLKGDRHPYGETLEDIVDRYKRENSPETRNVLLVEIKRFTSEHANDLDDALRAIYSGIYPETWGKTTRLFDELTRLLKA